jgi:3',5'-cyclic-AMP phosphodiesterase
MSVSMVAAEHAHAVDAAMRPRDPSFFEGQKRLERDPDLLVAAQLMGNPFGGRIKPVLQYTQLVPNENVMRVVSIQPQPIHTIAYQLAGSAGRTITAQLPILVGTVDVLPARLRAIVCLSDLQGIEPPWIASGRPRLLGEVVAEELSLLATLGELPPSDAIGILLAGDLYATPAADQRGVEGDVRPVWHAFHTAFRWVAGVPGNHDRFGESPTELAELAHRARLYYLDGTTCIVDELDIAGIGGIIGNPAKPFRRTEVQFIATLKKLSMVKPDILILHESPAVKEQAFLGSPVIRAALETSALSLVICGHTQWMHPLAELANGCQVLNVDSRVIILRTNDANER